ncbi:MAG: hydroxylamine reductase, partial [Bacteroidales bacterium]|nr:hydroxylamine reductase [Bacteroidales bacterium]
MSMFCYQCQETAKGTGCTIAGVCGKKEDVANMQDLLIFVTKGISVLANAARKQNYKIDDKINRFVFDSLFVTITNANFDKEAIIKKIRNGLKLRDEFKSELKTNGIELPNPVHSSVTWYSDDISE